MTREDAEKYLRLLGQELQKKGVTGEVLVGSGIIVLLDIKNPEITDIDAYFSNTAEFENIHAYFGGHGATLRSTAQTIAMCESLPEDWIDTAIKGIFDTNTDVADKGWLEYPNGWLNSAAAGFTYNFKKQPDKNLWKSFPVLDVYVVSLDYLFVTKIVAGRQKDREDIKALAAKLNLVTRQDVMTLVTKYVAREDISKEVLRQIAYMFKA
jgi:hypothetical protein